MKKVFSLPNLALAIAVTLIFCEIFLPARERSFALETTVTATVNTRFQFFYDIGHGIGEEDTRLIDIGAGVPETLHFDLPEGTYRNLRIDPLDRLGSAKVTALRLLSPRGRLVRSFPLSDFTVKEEATSRDLPDGSAEIVATGKDPKLALSLSPALVLHEDALDRFLDNAPRLGFFCLAAFIAMAVGQFLVHRLSQSLHAAWGWRKRHPESALAALALLAALLACYPLVIAGKSLVSPNLNVALLYEQCPFLPGYEDRRLENVHGADIGAMMWQHLPATGIQHQAVFQDGELPLWNRYGSCGITLLGQGQLMVGDPLNWPVVLANGASWAWDLKYILLRALFACGLGWTVFALRRDWGASALVTFSAAFIGFFTFRVNHPAIFSVCYAPWVLCAWVRLIQAPNGRATAGWLAALFAANWSLLNSGTAKEAYMLLASLNAIGGAAFLFTRDPSGLKFRKVIALALTGVAFALASMPIWLTFADALARARTSYDIPGTVRIPRSLLIGFFDDLFYGDLTVNRSVYCPSMNLLLLTGVLWSLAYLRAQLVDPITRWLVGGGLLALGIAFDWIPSTWLVQVPLVRNIIHLSNTFSCVGIVIWAVLAGCGFAAVRTHLLKASERPLCPAIAWVLMAVGMLFFYFKASAAIWGNDISLQAWLAQVPAHAFFYANVGAMLVGIALLHLIAARAAQHRVLTWSMTSWTVLALVVLLMRHGLQLSFGLHEDYFLRPMVRVNLHTSSPTVEKLQAAVAREPFRVIGTGNTLMPNFNALYGLEAISGPDALMNRHYWEIIATAQIAGPGDWYAPFDSERANEQQPVLDFLNVKFCITPLRTLAPDSGYERIADLDLFVYSSPTVWPRAFFTNRIIPYRNATQLIALTRANRGKPFAAILENDLGNVQAQMLDLTVAANQITQPASDYKLTANSTSFTVQAPSPGLIVLHEAWLKGDFRATVNGEPAQYFRVNHAFKGIVVNAAGHYRVTFTYWPRYLTLSLTCAVAGFILFAGLLAFVRSWKSASPVVPILRPSA